jgi:hypothetical protein
MTACELSIQLLLKLREILRTYSQVCPPFTLSCSHHLLSCSLALIVSSPALMPSLSSLLPSSTPALLLSRCFLLSPLMLSSPFFLLFCSSALLFPSYPGLLSFRSPSLISTLLSLFSSLPLCSYPLASHTLNHPHCTLQHTQSPQGMKMTIPQATSSQSGLQCMKITESMIEDLSSSSAFHAFEVECCQLQKISVEVR